MRERSYTRRQVLGVGAAGLLTGLAGCSAGTETDGPGGASGDLELVPADVTIVGRIEVAQLLSDPVVESSVENALSALAEQRPGLGGPEGFEDVLTMAEGQLGIDPREIDVVTMLFESPDMQDDDGLGGIVIETELSESAVLTAISSDLPGSFTERTYEGATMHEPEDGSGALGVVADGVYVLGTVPLCEAVVDRSNGSGAGISEALRTAYEGAPEGPIRFGADVSAWSDRPTSGPFSSVQTAAGGIALDGDQRRMALEMTTDDPSAAGQIETALREGLSELQSRAASESTGSLAAEFDQLENIELEHEGTTVTASSTATAEEAGELGALMAAVIGAFVLELGSQQSRMPKANFDVSYDEDSGSVTITHAGGDAIPAENLVIVTDSGRQTWASVSAEVGADDGVVAGYSVTVSVATASTVRLVYEDEDMSSVLISRDVPAS